MGEGEIKRKGFNEMLTVLCRLLVEVELARKDDKEEATFKIGGDLHSAILNAVEIATSPPSKGEKDRRGAQPRKPTAN